MTCRIRIHDRKTGPLLLCFGEALGDAGKSQTGINPGDAPNQYYVFPQNRVIEKLAVKS